MKTILITGSSRGIGQAIALALAQKNYSIVVHGRTESTRLQQTLQQVQALGAQVRSLCFDVSDRQQCRLMLNNDIKKYGIYYGIVLNAGVTRDNAFPFMSEPDWDEVLSTNLDSFYNVLRPLIEPLIVARCPARIVALASASGLLGNRGQVNYSAAKAGVIGAVKALALELAKRKITVNCVAPGLIETDMTQDLDQQNIVPYIPMKRIGTSQEVAAAVEFLLSDRAAYITRQTIAVDGGLS